MNKASVKIAAMTALTISSMDGAGWWPIQYGYRPSIDLDKKSDAEKLAKAQAKRERKNNERISRP